MGSWALALWNISKGAVPWNSVTLHLPSTKVNTANVIITYTWKHRQNPGARLSAEIRELLQHQEKRLKEEPAACLLLPSNMGICKKRKESK